MSKILYHDEGKMLPFSKIAFMKVSCKGTPPVEEGFHASFLKVFFWFLKESNALLDWQIATPWPICVQGSMFCTHFKVRSYTCVVILWSDMRALFSSFFSPFPILHPHSPLPWLRTPGNFLQESPLLCLEFKELNSNWNSLMSQRSCAGPSRVDSSGVPQLLSTILW